MLANNTGRKVRQLAAGYPGMIGHLFGPGTQRGPVPGFEYAFDNNRFGAWKNGTEWSMGAWLKLLDWGVKNQQKPRWALVPDVVTDRNATLREWSRYRDFVADRGFSLAFAVQDGMTALDVPRDADVVFVGGSTEWKWRTMRGWCSDFPRVHVGRVNTYKLLYKCHDAGAEGTDGTGFTRGCQRQWRGLVAYLDECSGAKERHTQGVLF